MKSSWEQIILTEMVDKMRDHGIPVLGSLSKSNECTHLVTRGRKPLTLIYRKSVSRDLPEFLHGECLIMFCIGEVHKNYGHRPPTPQDLAYARPDNLFFLPIREIDNELAVHAILEILKAELYVEPVMESRRETYETTSPAALEQLIEEISYYFPGFSGSHRHQMNRHNRTWFQSGGKVFSMFRYHSHECKLEFGKAFFTEVLRSPGMLDRWKSARMNENELFRRLNRQFVSDASFKLSYRSIAQRKVRKGFAFYLKMISNHFTEESQVA